MKHGKQINLKREKKSERVSNNKLKLMYFEQTRAYRTSIINEMYQMRNIYFDFLWDAVFWIIIILKETVRKIQIFLIGEKGKWKRNMNSTKYCFLSLHNSSHGNGLGSSHKIIQVTHSSSVAESVEYEYEETLNNKT